MRPGRPARFEAEGTTAGHRLPEAEQLQPAAHLLYKLVFVRAPYLVVVLGSGATGRTPTMDQPFWTPCDLSPLVLPQLGAVVHRRNIDTGMFQKGIDAFDDGLDAPGAQRVEAMLSTGKLHVPGLMR